MTDSEYQQILRDSNLGAKRISCQMAGSKNLFIHVSPSLFKKETGSSVWLSCFLTRAVVYVLDPVAVVFSVIAAVYWIGMPGVSLAVLSLFLWGVCKMYFANWLPAGWVVLLTSVGVGVLGAFFLIISGLQRILAP